MSEAKPEIITRTKKGSEVKSLTGLPGQQKHASLKDAFKNVGKDMSNMHISYIKGLDQRGVKV